MYADGISKPGNCRDDIEGKGRKKKLNGTTKLNGKPQSLQDYFTQNMKTYSLFAILSIIGSSSECYIFIFFLPINSECVLDDLALSQPGHWFRHLQCQWSTLTMLL